MGVPVVATRFDYKAIWREAKVNQASLNGCPGPHVFQLIDPPEKVFGTKYRCNRCQGVVDQHAYLWYAIGQDHARRELSAKAPSC